MSNILITGCAGYIGQAITDLMLEKGHTVVGIDNFQTSNKEWFHKKYFNLPAEATSCISNKSKTFSFFNNNYANPSLLEYIFCNRDMKEVDWVFHLAGETTVEDSMTELSKYFNNNVSGGIILLEAMRKAESRDRKVKNIIFASSCAVYGSQVSVFSDSLNEKTLPFPESPYAESKLMFEKILKWYSQCYGFTSTIFRFFNAAGATDKGGDWRTKDTHILPIMYDCLYNDKDFTINGDDYETVDGTCVRDYIHVEDIAKAFLNVVDHYANANANAKDIYINMPHYGIYNLGSELGFSVKGLINILSQTIDNKVLKVVNGKRREGDPAVLIADTRKVESFIGWKPEHTIVDIIESGWDWYLMKQTLKL